MCLIHKVDKIKRVVHQPNIYCTIKNWCLGYLNIIIKITFLLNFLWQRSSKFNRMKYL